VEKEPCLAPGLGVRGQEEDTHHVAPPLGMVGAKAADEERVLCFGPAPEAGQDTPHGPLRPQGPNPALSKTKFCRRSVSGSEQ